MQKSSVVTVTGIVLLVAAIAGAEYYFFEYRPRAAEAALNGADYGAGLPEVSNLSGAEDSNIIECDDPEVGTFYSDAESCEEAEPPDPPESP